MKKCFIITSYCETDDKKKSLKDTIERIKKYGYDILVYSHYPVDEDIQSISKYVVYDYSNPIFSYKEGSRAIINWRLLPTIPFKISSLIDDYGYAVIQQIKRGLLKMNSLGYDYAIILNYDTKFSDEFFNDVEKSMEEYDAFFLDFSDGNTPAYFLPFFAIKIDKFIENIRNISVNDYLEKSYDLMAEGYIAKTIKDNIKVVTRNDWEDKNMVWTDIIFIGDYFNRVIDDKCNFFIGLEKVWHNNNLVDFNNLSFLCYSIREDFNIKFEYNNEEIFSSKVLKNNYYYSNLPIPFSDFDSEKIKVFVNDKEVYKDYIKNIKWSSIEIIK